MNLDRDTALLAIRPAVVSSFCMPTFWMQSLLDRDPASEGWHFFSQCLPT